VDEEVDVRRYPLPPVFTPFGPPTAPLAPFFRHCMFDLGSISQRFITFYHLGSSAGGVTKWASRVYNRGISEPAAAYSWAFPADFWACAPYYLGLLPRHSLVFRAERPHASPMISWSTLTVNGINPGFSLKCRYE